MSTSTHAQPPSPTPQPPLGTPAGPTTATKPAWYRRTWVLVTAAVLVGLTLGASAGATDPTTTEAYKAVVAERDGARAELTTAEDALAKTEDDLEAAQTEVQSVLGDLPAREDALDEDKADLKAAQAEGKADLKAAQTRLNKRAQDLAAAEKDVAARERKVGIVETTIAKNTIAGEGMYEVGNDIKPGTYKTTGSTGCYYAVLSSPDTFDIVNNNNVDGPAILSVSNGQYLELSGCADWIWQQ